MTCRRSSWPWKRETYDGREERRTTERKRVREIAGVVCGRDGERESVGNAPVAEDVCDEKERRAVGRVREHNEKDTVCCRAAEKERKQ